MTSAERQSAVGVLFSGGLDSSIMLAHLMERGHTVQPIYVRFHLAWEPVEHTAARRFLVAVAGPALLDLVTLEMPVTDLYGDHWSVSGQDVPAAGTPDSAVYLPGRNALLLLKPLLWCQHHGIDRLALAALKSNPFADATAEFFAGFESAVNQATGGSTRAIRPFAEFDKRQVMQAGQSLPLQWTFSCIAPRGDLHCGQCNKCEERQEAFRTSELRDPTQYADAPFRAGSH